MFTKRTTLDRWMHCGYKAIIAFFHCASDLRKRVWTSPVTRWLADNFGARRSWRTAGLKYSVGGSYVFGHYKTFRSLFCRMCPSISICIVFHTKKLFSLKVFVENPRLITTCATKWSLAKFFHKGNKKYKALNKSKTLSIFTKHTSKGLFHVNSTVLHNRGRFASHRTFKMRALCA